MGGNGEDFSVFVSQTLNTIGYNIQTIQQRREIYKYFDQMTNRIHLDNGLTILTVGSKREGVTYYFGGDSDCMIIFDEVICYDDNNIDRDDRNTTVFKMEFEDTSPGYTFLRLDRHGGRIGRNVFSDGLAAISLQSFIETVSIQTESGNKYVSSDVFFDLYSFLDRYIRELTGNFRCTQQTRAGPSLPSVAKVAGIIVSLDTVYSFKCQCPSIFQSYLARKRHHGWPPQHLLEELSELDAHVVPVGDKNSPTRSLEWRICFTKAEIRLIEHLNPPQTHLLILLKIFTKEVLKKCCDSMTSYVVKNVILWIAELVKEDRFQVHTLVERFLDCLLFVKACLKQNNLPNYMISKRNLLNKIDNKSKYTLLCLLDECICEGSSCLLRSEKLREALVRRYTNQQLSVELGIRRDESETATWSFVLRNSNFVCMSNPLQVQDIINLVQSGNARELEQLFLQRISLEDFFKDPIAVATHVLQEYASHFF